MKAGALLKRNIDTLLKARGQTNHDLAFWCRRTDSWISKLLSDKANAKGDRGIPVRYLDRIADFFGVSVYQLFQPGISHLTERRATKERRALQDRRINARPRDLPVTPMRGLSLTADDEAILSELHALTHAEFQRVRHWIQVTRLGRSSGPAPIPPDDPPRPARRRGTTTRRTRVARATEK